MKHRGQLTFVFDDGYQEVYNLVVPLLEKYGFRGVFAIALEPSSLIQETQQSIKPWQEWLSLKEKKHELAAHSVSHTNLTTCSPIQLQHELKEPATQLLASTLIYPGGAYNEIVIREAQKLYKAARTVKKGFNTLKPDDLYQLKTYNFTKHNFSVFKANLLTLWAWLTNSWLIETYHLVTDQDSPLLHSTKLTDFEQHLRFVSRLPIAVQTIEHVTKPQ